MSIQHNNKLNSSMIYVAAFSDEAKFKYQSFPIENLISH